MRNKPWKNAQTAIELTSLLDVIFIVLMIVVCNQQINTKAEVEAARAEAIAAAEAEVEYTAQLSQLTEKQAEAERMLAEAQKMKDEQEAVIREKDFYAQQLDTYAGIQNQILALTVYVDYDPADIKNRKIRILKGNEEMPAIEVTPDNMTEAYLKMETALAGVLEESEGMPVIASVSKGKMLYRDERAVAEVLAHLGTRFPNLYQKIEGEAANE